MGNEQSKQVHGGAEPPQTDDSDDDYSELQQQLMQDMARQPRSTTGAILQLGDPSVDHLLGPGGLLDPSNYGLTRQDVLRRVQGLTGGERSNAIVDMLRTRGGNATNANATTANATTANTTTPNATTTSEPRADEPPGTTSPSAPSSEAPRARSEAAQPSRIPRKREGSPRYIDHRPQKKHKQIKRGDGDWQCPRSPDKLVNRASLRNHLEKKHGTDSKLLNRNQFDQRNAPAAANPQQTTTARPSDGLGAPTASDLDAVFGQDRPARNVHASGGDGAQEAESVSPEAEDRPIYAPKFRKRAYIDFGEGVEDIPADIQKLCESIKRLPATHAGVYPGRTELKVQLGSNFSANDGTLKYKSPLNASRWVGDLRLFTAEMWTYLTGSGTTVDLRSVQAALDDLVTQTAGNVSSANDDGAAFQQPVPRPSQNNIVRESFANPQQARDLLNAPYDGRYQRGNGINNPEAGYHAAPTGHRSHSPLSHEHLSAAANAPRPQSGSGSSPIVESQSQVPIDEPHTYGNSQSSAILPAKLRDGTVRRPNINMNALSAESGISSGSWSDRIRAVLLNVADRTDGLRPSDRAYAGHLATELLRSTEERQGVQSRATDGAESANNVDSAGRIAVFRVILRACSKNGASKVDR
ncbi:hypothetical protein LTR85_008190 [Meristemomyces frigidus]|nr:hypothetical protein LTR85_008190 [Meristemomyces frigidus]